jgi:uncharacterized membrane protein YczE
MFLAGILLLAYGTGLYVATRFGAEPRDSLMIALTNKTGWKIRNVRGRIEVIALLIGWGLGGPANWGTILYCSLIGPLCGIALPQMDKLTILLLQLWKKEYKTNFTKVFNITK